jgi:hypothetical protein
MALDGGTGRAGRAEQSLFRTAIGMTSATHAASRVIKMHACILARAVRAVDVGVHQAANAFVDIGPVVVRWIHVRLERDAERLPKQIVIIGDTVVPDRYRYAFDHAALFLWVGKPYLSPGGNLLAVVALAFVGISISYSKFLSVVHHLSTRR